MSRPIDIRLPGCRPWRRGAGGRGEGAARRSRPASLTCH